MAGHVARACGLRRKRISAACPSVVSVQVPYRQMSGCAQRCRTCVCDDAPAARAGSAAFCALRADDPPGRRSPAAGALCRQPARGTSVSCKHVTRQSYLGALFVVVSLQQGPLAALLCRPSTRSRAVPFLAYTRLMVTHSTAQTGRKATVTSNVALPKRRWACIALPGAAPQKTEIFARYLRHVTGTCPASGSPSWPGLVAAGCRWADRGRLVCVGAGAGHNFLRACKAPLMCPAPPPPAVHSPLLLACSLRHFTNVT